MCMSRLGLQTTLPHLQTDGHVEQSCLSTILMSVDPIAFLDTSRAVWYPIIISTLWRWMSHWESLHFFSTQYSIWGFCLVSHLNLMVSQWSGLTWYTEYFNNSFFFFFAKILRFVTFVLLFLKWVQLSRHSFSSWAVKCAHVWGLEMTDVSLWMSITIRERERDTVRERGIDQPEIQDGTLNLNLVGHD